LLAVSVPASPAFLILLGTDTELREYRLQLLPVPDASLVPKHFKKVNKKKE
jgi:hypothetical protein